jgi:hypothetical protein
LNSAARRQSQGLEGRKATASHRPWESWIGRFGVSRNRANICSLLNRRLSDGGEIEQAGKAGSTLG